MREPLSLESAMKEADRCLLCQDAPCSEGCPAGTDPGKFIRQIKFENFKGAARTIRNNNPLGSVCSLICPTDKLCEKKCSAKALEDPINIGALQKFAVEYAKQNGIEPLAKPDQNKGKIAVIGAGPAGIGCAAELAKMGYEVTIFEKEKEAGGVAKWGIPAYRLCDEMIAYDIKNLLDLGVKIKYSSKIANKGELSNDYKAVFIAGGMTVPFELPIFKGYTNAITSTQLLRDAKTDIDKLKKCKDKVVAVIGGGSVAMDAACTAAALGAKKVYAISLEGLAELPADSEEIEIAHELNVIFKPCSQITEVVAQDNVIVGLKGKEIEWIKPNNFSPDNAKQIDGTEFSVKVDCVVQAIGSKPAAEIAGFAPGLKTAGKGTIVVNEDYSTNISGVFAGGDVVNGGATAVLAVGEGKKAAASIDKYVSKLAK